MPHDVNSGVYQSTSPGFDLLEVVEVTVWVNCHLPAIGQRVMAGPVLIRRTDCCSSGYMTGKLRKQKKKDIFRYLVKIGERQCGWEKVQASLGSCPRMFGHD